MRTFASKHVAQGRAYSRWTAAFWVVAPHHAPEAVSFRALRALSAVARYPARGSDSQRMRTRAPVCGPCSVRVLLVRARLRGTLSPHSPARLTA